MKLNSFQSHIARPHPYLTSQFTEQPSVAQTNEDDGDKGCDVLLTEEA